MPNWDDLLAKKNERILPKWNALVGRAGRSKITFGEGVKASYIPSGGLNVSGENKPQILRHPWKIGGVNFEYVAEVKVGLVDGNVPFVSEDLKLGDDNDGEIAGVKLKKKKEGTSFIALGVNVSNSKSDSAKLDDEPDFNQLRIAEIEELPSGLGSGGTLEDSEGWAWYPLIQLEWEEEFVVRTFQIVFHNLGHFVAPMKEGKPRHFFPPI